MINYLSSLPLKLYNFAHQQSRAIDPKKENEYANEFLTFSTNATTAYGFKKYFNLLRGTKHPLFSVSLLLGAVWARAISSHAMKMDGQQNTPIPNINGSGLFYVSPGMKGGFAEFRSCFFKS